MKAHISKVGATRNVARVNNILRHEIEVGEIKSISSILSKRAVIKITVAPSTSQETVHTICHKMNEAGYSTKVLPPDRYHTCFPSSVQRGYPSRKIRAASGSIIIAGKVTLPNLPSTPVKWPSPDGTPPKKKKRKRSRGEILLWFLMNYFSHYSSS